MDLPTGAAGLVTVLWAICVLGVFGAPSSKCPPGGQYLDKHLGEKGRMQCCSELCEVTWLQEYQDMCRKHCPDYEAIKARETKAEGTDDQPKPAEVAADSSSGEDSTHIVVVSVLVPVGIILVIIIALFILIKRRGWAGGHSSILPFRSNHRPRGRGEVGLWEDNPGQNLVLEELHHDGSQLRNPGVGQGPSDDIQQPGYSALQDTGHPLQDTGHPLQDTGRYYQTAEVERSTTGRQPVQAEDESGGQMAISP